MNFNNIAIVNIYGGEYHQIINGINKREAINLLKNANLREKSKAL